eukprot:Awhi_evm1s13647
MKSVAAVLFFAACANGLATVEEFVTWQKYHGKVYEHDIEHKMRFGIWQANHATIEEFNRGDHSYKLAMNEYGDLTHDEFKIRNGYLHHKYERNPDNRVYQPTGKKIPKSKDWRDDKVVSEVKNQGSCGSCYSFSATGSLEGQYMKKTGKKVSLSEQQVVDCSKENNGCGGGLMDNVFKYINKAGGLESEREYPYVGRVERQCRADKSEEFVDVASFVDIPSGDEAALTEAIATEGPISVGIDASHFSFQFYHSGVYNSWICSSTRLDHGVLAVGYGVEDSTGKEYYIVKNSWGPSWGQGGYLWMSRNKNNQCGIATTASYPVLSTSFFSFLKALEN